MNDEQRRYLWQVYREEQAAGGPARDRLPYTDHFNNIRARFNARFNMNLSEHAIWNALSDLDKAPDRRKQLLCVA